MIPATTSSQSLDSTELPIQKGIGVWNSGEKTENFCRSLLRPADLRKIEEDIKGGFMTIAEVRRVVHSNAIKESQLTRGEALAIDPDLMVQIDPRIDYNIFVDGDDVFTHEEMMGRFPFEEYRTTPEQVFVQQEIGLFLDTGYISRDVPDDANVPFTTFGDMLKPSKDRRTPIKTAVTKIFVGKQKWQDFRAIVRLAASFDHFVTPALKSGGGGAFRSFVYPNNCSRAIDGKATAQKSELS